MSGKVGFSDKFSNKFHIGKVPRKPLREEVTGLRARALKLPQTNPEVEDVVIKLEDAKNLIFGKAKTNTAREDSVTKTQHIVNFVKPELERLEKEKPEKIAYKVNGKKATKEDVKRAKDVLAMLTPLQKDVETLFTPSGDAPLVFMPANLGRMDLLGQIETVRVHISQTIVDENQGLALSKEIGAARKKIVEARTYITNCRNTLGTYDKQWADGSTVLMAVSKELAVLARDKSNGKVPPATDTRLAQLLNTLRDATHPPLGMILPEGLKRASDAVAAEIQLAKSDPAAYAKKCCVGSKNRDTIEATLQIFDGLMTEPLKQLYEHASAMGAMDHATLSGEIAVARSGISGQIVAEQVNVPAITDPLLEKVNAAIDRLRKEAEALRKRVTDAHTALNTTLQGIAPTKGPKFFAADWIAIDALLNTINGLIPADKAPLNQETIDKLGSVEPLIARLRSTAEALDASKSGPAEQKFDVAKAAMEKIIKKGDPPSATLKRYDPKKWAELEEGYNKAEASIGVSKFADALKAIEDFKTSKFDPAIKAGKELAPVIATARKLRDKCDNLFVAAQMVEPETGFPKPNTQNLALSAIKSELKKTPPDKAMLEQLTTALEAAFKDIKNGVELMKAISTSNKVEIANAKTAKAETETNREPLKNRYYALEMQFAEAKALVKGAKGDENPVKMLERMMEQANSEIKAVSADKKTITKPNATMDRIQQRINLMIAHPEGEANRRLTELPGLYNEFRQTRADAQGHLQGILGLIGEFMTEQGNEKGVEDLLDRVSEYIARFTMNGDTFSGSVDVLADTERPEGERRKAREKILAGVAELQRGILSHPISKLLAESPFAGAKGVPARLIAVLDRLNFTVLTSVE